MKKEFSASLAATTTGDDCAVALAPNHQWWPDWLFDLLQGCGLLLLAVLLFNLLTSVSAIASTQSPEDMVLNPEWPGAGTLEWQGDNTNNNIAPGLKTDVNMQVSGLTNRVTVTQHYTNHSEQWLNGRYLFPLPENAAVDSLQMKIGERLIAGQIKPRKEARQLYEQAKADGKRASLLSQQRPNLFTAEVANLGPGQTLEIRFSYQQALDYRDGQFNLRFPMTLTPRYIPAAMLTSAAKLPEVLSLQTLMVDNTALRQEQASANRTSINIVLDAGLPLASVSSASHQIQQQPQDDGSMVITLSNALPDRDFVLDWQPQAANAPTAALYSQLGQTYNHSSDNHDAPDTSRYSLLMMMPPAVKPQTDNPRELILVIDTSGSMAGDAMAQAKSAVLYALSGLKPQDSFNILAFSSDVQPLAPQALPVTAHNIGLAQQFVRSLEANGGTEMAKALQLALPFTGDTVANESDAALRQVIFMTDGAVGNEDQLFTLIRDRLGNNRLFTIGIGSAPNSHFMRRAAELGRGTFTYIGNMQQVEQQTVSLLNKIAAPVLTDVQLHYADGTVPDYWPAHIPDLYMGEPMLLSLRERSAEQKALIVSGNLQGQFWQQQVLLQADTEKRGLDLLWARQQIASLELARSSDNAERTAKQVTALALTYHLVSSYTSLVAVDITPVNTDPQHNAVGEVANMNPAGWQAPGNMPQTATNSRLRLLMGTLLLIVAMLLGIWKRQFAATRSC
ncbi:marine proteobacterial sortase target protein [Shewanella fodinae]|uniref:marine proteobacterial sortase target protein n=1 Tax=Shewanella fodinae TaxID=552357 RepID=UPI001671CBE9|nr:marine proteobacterial sortase target protein [Shewanella fodinae]MCL2905141.1 marine proteobacterial sortase target protein [Shewanella fodinae]GGY88249.1 marine proteobacterial sortase target protein [Shewanella fodinae]